MAAPRAQSRAVKRVFEMNDLPRFGVTWPHQDHIKAQVGCWAFVQILEGMGRLDQPPLLPRGGHPLPRVGGVAAPGTALHFDEHRGVAVARNNVQLRSPPSPVSGEDAVPQTFQMCHSPLLALLACPDATFQNHGTRVAQSLGGRTLNAQAGVGNGSAQDQVGGADHSGSLEDVHHVGSCRQRQAPKGLFR